MAVCIAVIGKDNSPQFIACSRPEQELHFHYQVHTSLDVVEEKLSSLSTSEIRKLYLGLLHSTEEYKIYGYATNTKVKFIIVCEAANKSLRENDIHTMFRKLHSSYVDIVSNPFYIPGDPLVSRLALQQYGKWDNVRRVIMLIAGISLLTNIEECMFGIEP